MKWGLAAATAVLSGLTALIPVGTASAASCGERDYAAICGCKSSSSNSTCTAKYKLVIGIPPSAECEWEFGSDPSCPGDSGSGGSGGNGSGGSGGGEGSGGGDGGSGGGDGCFEQGGGGSSSCDPSIMCCP